MKSASEELKKLRSISEKYLKKTAKLDKVLSQIESTLIQTDDQGANYKKYN